MPFPPPPDETDTARLLERVQSGEREAWDELYRRYHDQLLLAVRLRLGRRLRRHLDSDDVLQSAALEALGALGRFEYRGPGSLRRYLERLVANKIRDRADTYGAQKRAGDVPLTDSVLAGLAAGGPEARYRDAERFERLERCLEQLPDDMRRVLLLRKLDGLSSREAAVELGRSEVATRKLCSRAMARLAALMGEG